MYHVGLLQEEFGSRLFETGAFLNLIVIERMNYGRYKIFVYPLIFFF